MCKSKFSLYFKTITRIIHNFSHTKINSENVSESLITRYKKLYKNNSYYFLLNNIKKKTFHNLSLYFDSEC